MNQEEARSLLKKRNGKTFISEGSSRKVYEIGGYIVKKAKNKRGRMECSNEHWLYTNIEAEHKQHLCPVVYFEEGIVIMEKAETIEFEYFEEHVKEPFQPLIQLLFKQYGMDDFDLGCGFNWGLLNGKPVIIDYGNHYFSEELEEMNI